MLSDLNHVRKNGKNSRIRSTGFPTSWFHGLAMSRHHPIHQIRYEKGLLFLKFWENWNNVAKFPSKLALPPKKAESQYQKHRCKSLFAGA